MYVGLIFFCVMFVVTVAKYKVKGPCKRSQHCWPTRRNIVGPDMLRAFAHHVVCCCVLLRLVGSCWMKFDTGQTHHFGADVKKRNNKKNSKNNFRTKLNLFHVKKAAGKGREYSENDKILKSRKMAILQRL